MKVEQITRGKPDLFETDLPDSRLQHYLSKSIVAVDTETRGLILHRDRLCLVQICDDEGVCSFVRYTDRNAPNLQRLLTEKSLLKLFHYGRFDISVMRYYLDAWTNPVWCTKIASKLVRTYTDKHGLKDLCREMLGLEMDKTDQTSDWARDDLSDSQLEYAANDVRVLIPLYRKMKAMLEREKKLELAEKLFAFLPTVCEMDMAGFNNVFEH